MRVFVISLIFLLISGTPVLALEKMSKTELKKTTGQLASSVGNASTVATPVAGIAGIALKLIEANSHIGNLRTLASPAVESQTPAEPATIVINVITDVNTVKSGVTFGFF